MKGLIWFMVLFFVSVKLVIGVPIEIRSAMPNKMADIAVAKLSHTLDALEPTIPDDKKWVIELINAESEAPKLTQLDIATGDLHSEGFQILPKNETIYIIGGDEKGLMYGILDVRDQLNLNPDLNAVEAKTVNPRFHFRAIKFNLPWSSYRLGESLQLHMETVKDTVFWAEFLDMMADNRFNALTLWNLHPYTFMI